MKRNAADNVARTLRVRCLPHAERADYRRIGLTLLEVIVAMAIFLMALVPITRLISLGTEHALDVNHRSQASMLCQSKMDSVKAGVEPLNATGTVEIGTMTWNYTIESTQ